jgi:hypothetical protein
MKQKSLISLCRYTANKLNKCDIEELRFLRFVEDVQTNHNITKICRGLK